MAEPTSCTKPGSVNSRERAAPPIVASASSTWTETPARASVIAAASPFGPEPTTIASDVDIRGILFHGDVAVVCECHRARCPLRTPAIILRSFTNDPCGWQGSLFSLLRKPATWKLVLRPQIKQADQLDCRDGSQTGRGTEGHTGSRHARVQ